jgi:hypothetical protein
VQPEEPPARPRIPEPKPTPRTLYSIFTKLKTCGAKTYEQCVKDYDADLRSVLSPVTTGTDKDQRAAANKVIKKLEDGRNHPNEAKKTAELMKTITAFMQLQSGETKKREK